MAKSEPVEIGFPNNNQAIFKEMLSSLPEKINIRALAITSQPVPAGKVTPTLLLPKIGLNRQYKPYLDHFLEQSTVKRALVQFSGFDVAQRVTCTLGNTATLLLASYSHLIRQEEERLLYGVNRVQQGARLLFSPNLSFDIKNQLLRWFNVYRVEAYEETYIDLSSLHIKSDPYLGRTTIENKDIN